MGIDASLAGGTRFADPAAMQNHTDHKRGKVAGNRKGASAARSERDEMPQPPSANAAADSVGSFQLGELGHGQAKVLRSGDGQSVRFVFEFVLRDWRPSDLTVDLVVGPANWGEGADVYEINAIPMVGSSALLEIRRSHLDHVVSSGRAQFYGRVHTPAGETYYINREGRPFENFEAML